MKRGFTLIELSIVLVIIGLIVGGIVVGKDLVEASKIRAQVSQFEQLTVAVNNFKNKYGCLPGDCSNATSFFTFPANTGQNGDGNGIIVSPMGQAYPYSMNGEPKVAMSSLNLSGLYNEAVLWNSSKAAILGEDILKAKIGIGGISFIAINSQNGYYLGLHGDEGNGVSNLFFGHYSSHGIITPQQAYNIDAKMDDGNGKTGKIYAAWTAPDTWTKPENVGLGSPTPSCITGSSYNIINGDSNDCRLFITGGW